MNIELARAAATAMLGVNPDPRESGYWNEYSIVNAKAFAALLDALNVPTRTVDNRDLTQSETNHDNYIHQA